MLLVGHRGAALRAPENTLPSFRLALELGAAAVELDLRLSRDGRLLCFHDDRLERLTPASGRVADHDWTELAALPVMPGSFGGAYDAGCPLGVRIPLFADVLSALPDARLVVELKAEPGRSELLVQAAVAAIAAAGAGPRCRVISFEPELLRRARALDPALELGVLSGPDQGDRLFPLAAELRAAVLHPHHRLVTAELLAAARAAGLRVNAWTVNDPAAAVRFAALGVEEITTDDPGMAWTAAGSE